MTQSEPLMPAERHQRILDVLRQELTIRGSRLSELLGVSEMTIRRDLDALERLGVVERIHGGAVFRQEKVVDKFHYQSSALEKPKEKQRIAQKAATMIEPEENIFIGEGITAAQMVRYVDSAMPFTIFTNNLGAVTETWGKAVELVLLSGTYDQNTHALAGPLTLELIQQVNATKVFLGADGLGLNAGLTTPNFEIAAIERGMIHQTRGSVIVLADHSKFGLVAEMVVTPIKHIDVLITDKKIPDDFQNDLESLNVQVVIV